jgi:hypothetical protein
VERSSISNHWQDHSGVSWENAEMCGSQREVRGQVKQYTISFVASPLTFCQFHFTAFKMVTFEFLPSFSSVVGWNNKIYYIYDYE